MNKEKLISFIKYLIVAIASAIVSFFSSSCAGGFVIGAHNRQMQEVHATADSAHFVPTITISR